MGIMYFNTHKKAMTKSRHLTNCKEGGRGGRGHGEQKALGRGGGGERGSRRRRRRRWMRRPLTREGGRFPGLTRAPYGAATAGRHHQLRRQTDRTSLGGEEARGGVRACRGACVIYKGVKARRSVPVIKLPRCISVAWHLSTVSEVCWVGCVVS